MILSPPGGMTFAKQRKLKPSSSFGGISDELLFCSSKEIRFADAKIRLAEQGQRETHLCS